MTTSSALSAGPDDLGQIVGGIWMEMLAVEHLGADDDFFKLGGNSLLATEVVLRLEELLGLTIDAAEVFDHPTFVDFVAEVARQSVAPERLEMVEGGFERSGSVSSPDDTAVLEDLLDRLAAGSAAPGIALEIRADGLDLSLQSGELMARTRRPMTADARFPIGCIAKSVVAVCCLELCRDGRLDLQAPVEDYLAELKSACGLPAPSVGHLLTHSAGALEPEDPSLEWSLDANSLSQHYRSRMQAYPPGAAWSYSRTGHYLLALVVERVSGTTVARLAQERVFDHCGIEPSAARFGRGACPVASHWFSLTSQRYEVSRTRPVSPMASLALEDLRLSAREAAACASWLARYGVGETDPASDWMIDAVIDIPHTTGGLMKEVLPSAWGLIGGRFLGATGLNTTINGVAHALRFDAASDFSVALAINAKNYAARDEILRHALYALTAQDAVFEPPALRLELPLAELDGTYQGLGLGQGQVQAAWTDGALAIFTREAGAAAPIAVLSVDADGYLLAQSANPMFSIGVFQDPYDGAPSLLMSHSAFKRTSAS